MRKLILKMSMSLDGFVARPDGDIRWIFGNDQAARARVLEIVSDASLHIMGSRTFRDMAGYWPTSTLPFAAPMNRVPKAVFSRQGAGILQAAAADSRGGPLQPGAETWSQAHVASGELADEIATLKASDGKPVVAHGGAAFARSLIAANLVDVFALMIHPIALGNGLPIFSGLNAPRRLELVDSTRFAGGTVAQIYRPA